MLPNNELESLKSQGTIEYSEEVWGKYRHEKDIIYNKTIMIYIYSKIIKLILCPLKEFQKCYSIEEYSGDVLRNNDFGNVS